MSAPSFLVLPDGNVISTVGFASSVEKIDGSAYAVFRSYGAPIKFKVATLSAAMEMIQKVISQIGALTNAPTLVSITLNTSAAGASTSFHIAGTNFVYGSFITIGGVRMLSPFFVSPTDYADTYTAGQLAAGVYDVVYNGLDGQIATLAGGFTVT